MKKNAIIVTLSILLLCAVGIIAYLWLAPAKEEPEEDYAEESIWSIIAYPEKYYGKRVYIYGVLGTEESGLAIYISKEAYENSVTKNALWIDTSGLSGDEEEELRSLAGKYISIQGIFEKDRGYNDAFSGAVKKIMGFWDKSKIRSGYIL